MNTEKKPIESVKTIGTECMSLLEWTTTLILAGCLAVIAKIKSISSIVLKCVAVAVIVLVCWIVWPLVIMALLVTGAVYAKKHGLFKKDDDEQRTIDAE